MGGPGFEGPGMSDGSPWPCLVGLVGHVGQGAVCREEEPTKGASAAASITKC